MILTFTVAQAAESRDALAKTLYSNLFDWLVAAINRKIPSYGADPTAGARSDTCSQHSARSMA